MAFGFFLSTNNSNGSTVRTADSMNNSANIEDSMDSIIFLSEVKDGSSVDAFGGKDMFGEPDFETMEATFTANGNQTETIGSLASAGAGAQTETIGSLACATSDSGFSADGAGECASAGCDSGSSCGGGCSFVG